MYVEVDQKKLNALIDSISKLDSKIQTREIQKILRRNLKPIENTMKALAPMRKTSYRKAIYNSEGVKVGYKSVKIPSLIRRYASRSKKGTGRGRVRGVKNGQGMIRDTYLRGNLKRSIAIRQPRKKYKTSDVEMWVGRRRTNMYDGWYAFFTNKGTKYQSGTNWVKKARKAHEKVAGGKISKELSKYIDQQIKKLGL